MNKCIDCKYLNESSSHCNSEVFCSKEIDELTDEAYQQGREDQKEEDLHGFTEEEATQYLYELGCKDTIKLYHKYVEANLEANNFDVLINDEIRDTLLSKSVEEVLKIMEQMKEQKNDCGL